IIHVGKAIWMGSDFVCRPHRDGSFNHRIVPLPPFPTVELKPNRLSRPCGFDTQEDGKHDGPSNKPHRNFTISKLLASGSTRPSAKCVPIALAQYQNGLLPLMIRISIRMMATTNRKWIHP